MAEPDDEPRRTDAPAVPEPSDRPPPSFDAPTPPAPEIEDPPERNTEF